MSRPTILHLDRSRANRSLVAAAHLRIAPGSALVQLVDVDAAREFFDSEETFDLALIAQDLAEPGEGLEFAKWLREEHPLAPPVYILEDELQPCAIVEAMAVGIEGVLPTGDPAAFTDALTDLFSLHLPTGNPRLI